MPQHYLELLNSLEETVYPYRNNKNREGNGRHQWVGLLRLVAQGGIKTTGRRVGVPGRSASKLALDPPVPGIVPIMEGPLPVPNIVLALIDKQILNHNVLHGVGFIAPYN
jgi:hypothetical protein